MTNEKLKTPGTKIATTKLGPHYAIYFKKNKRGKFKACLDIFPSREGGFENVILAERTNSIDMKPLINAAAVEMMTTRELPQLNPVIIL